MWVRERATIKDSPALASHADKVSKIRFFDKRRLLANLAESITKPIKSETIKSSRHKRMDRR